MEQRLVRLLWYGAVAAAVYGALRYALPALLPFLLALALAAALEPVVSFLHRKLRWKRGFTAAVVTLALLAVLAALVIGLAARCVEQALALLAALPHELESLSAPLDDLRRRVDQFCADCPATLRRWLEQGLSDLPRLAATVAGQLSGKALGWLSRLMSSLPALLLGCGTTVLAVFFTLESYPQVMAFLRRCLPPDCREKAAGWKAGALGTLGKWLRAECLLLGVTFVQLLAGFWLLGQEYAVLLAVVIALIDALPVLGTGTVLLPWAAICCLLGDVGRGMALAALYLVIFAVRSVLEPKVMASQAGLPPLATLAAMYVGFRLMGVGGMLLFPIALLLWREVAGK